MNPAQLERLRDQLTRLRLFKSRERLDALLQAAAATMHRLKPLRTSVHPITYDNGKEFAGHRTTS